MARKDFTIGWLASQTNCKIQTIRYYEQVGLLKLPPRSQGGHRHFGEAALKRLSFILRARQLGFSLDTVRALLTLADGEGRTCEEVHQIAASHLEDVRAKQTNLEVMEKVLAEMVLRCADGTLPECPLIEELFDVPAGGGKKIP